MAKCNKLRLGNTIALKQSGIFWVMLTEMAERFLRAMESWRDSGIFHAWKVLLLISNDAMDFMPKKESSEVEVKRLSLRIWMELRQRKVGSGSEIWLNWYSRCSNSGRLLSDGVSVPYKLYHPICIYVMRPPLEQPT